MCKHQKTKKHFNLLNNIQTLSPNEKVNCECEATYSQSHKSRHFKSNKHLTLMANKSTIL